MDINGAIEVADAAAVATANAFVDAAGLAGDAAGFTGSDLEERTVIQLRHLPGIIWQVLKDTNRPLRSQIELWAAILFLVIALGSITLYVSLKIMLFITMKTIHRKARQRRTDLLRRHLDKVENYDRKTTNYTNGQGQCSPLEVPLIFGFFHPRCNAGGGGERVLWTGIQALQREYPNIVCLIYSTETDCTPNEIIDRAKTTFNTDIDAERVYFEQLRFGWLADSKSWPFFTMLLQAVGSMLLGFEAICRMPPDAFIDTVGYAFSYPIAHFILDIPVASYVHYPMVGWHTVADRSFSLLKRAYFLVLFAFYAVSGHAAQIVMANSKWTLHKMASAWGRGTILYPPCDFKELSALRLDSRDERLIVSVSQYREEKRHLVLLEAMKSVLKQRRDAKLVFCGSIRGQQDLVWLQKLKAKAADLGLSGNVEFKTDLAWPQLLQIYGRASIGVNPMKDEHFGITVVEYQAAGCLTVAHQSGGPCLDILVPLDDEPTGFLSQSSEDFASKIVQAMNMPADQQLDMRERARRNAKRFSRESFDNEWLKKMDQLRRLATRMRTLRILRAGDHIILNDATHTYQNVTD